LAQAVTNAGQKKNNDNYIAANAKRERVKKKRTKSAANDKSVQCAANLFY